jgi:hypothetical protein
LILPDEPVYERNDFSAALSEQLGKAVGYAVEKLTMPLSKVFSHGSRRKGISSTASKSISLRVPR